MHIELLWVIPIISFAVFLFIVAYQAQKGAERRSRTSLLSREVALYNAGQEVPGGVDVERNEERLRELEKAINLLIDVVGCQSKTSMDVPVGGKNAEDASSAATQSEVNELKEKLRTVFKEYDILLSENYTLRAKVKQLSKQLNGQEERHAAPIDTPILSAGRAEDSASPALQLYDDTRFINLSQMDVENRSPSS